MPDTTDDFGGIAVEDAPAGQDQFGGVPVESGPDLSKIKLSPYDQAAIESFRQGRGKPESGMEAPTSLLTAMGASPVGRALTSGAEAVGGQIKDTGAWLADAYMASQGGENPMAGLEAVAQPVARAAGYQLGEAGKALWRPVGGLAGESDWDELSKQYPKLMAVPKVVKGMVESAPKMAAQTLLGPEIGPAVWGLTDEGFDAKTAATMYALPWVKNYTGAIAENVASKMGVNSELAKQVVNRVAGGTAMAGLLTADQIDELRKLSPEERAKKAPETIGNALAMFAMGTLERGQMPEKPAKVTPMTREALDMPEGSAVPPKVPFNLPDAAPAAEPPARPQVEPTAPVSSELPGEIVPDELVSPITSAKERMQTLKTQGLSVEEAAKKLSAEDIARQQAKRKHLKEGDIIERRQEVYDLDQDGNIVHDENGKPKKKTVISQGYVDIENGRMVVNGKLTGGLEDDSGAPFGFESGDRIIRKKPRSPVVPPKAKTPAPAPPVNAEAPPVIAPEVTNFIEELRQPEGKPGGTNRATEAGLKVTSITELDALAAEHPRILAESKAAMASGDMDKAMMLVGKVQLPREAIEAAANVGSNTVETDTRLSNGKPKYPTVRPLDWRTHPEVADWLRANGKRIGIALPDELKAPKAAAAPTEPAAEPVIRESQTTEQRAENAKRFQEAMSPQASQELVDDLRKEGWTVSGVGQYGNLFDHFEISYRGHKVSESDTAQLGWKKIMDGGVTSSPEEVAAIRKQQLELQTEFANKYGPEWSGKDLSKDELERWKASTRPAPPPAAAPEKAGTGTEQQVLLEVPTSPAARSQQIDRLRRYDAALEKQVKSAPDTTTKEQFDNWDQRRTAIQTKLKALEGAALKEAKAPTPAPKPAAPEKGMPPGPGMIGMGGGVQTEFSPPTIGDLIDPSLRKAFSQLPPDRLAATTEKPTTGFLSNLASYFTTGKATSVSESIKGWLGTMAGKTLPRTTLKDRLSGELGGRWVASRAAAAPMGNVFVNDVLAGLPIEPSKFHGALLSDNLLSIRDAFTAESEKLKAQAAKEGSPEKIDQALKLEDAAKNVNTLLGTKKFPFKTEAELQAYFKQPEVTEAIKRHQDNWKAAVEPLYRTTQNIDPEVELPTRGKYSQARLNLNPVVEGEYQPGNGPMVGGSTGSLSGTMRRRNPFARRAMGTGQSYVLNYAESIANSFAKQLEIANKKAFEDRLVETGNAVISDQGKRVTLPDGSAAKGYPLIRRGFQNKQIYVRGSLAREYEIAANVHLSPYQGNLLVGFNKAFAQAALAGLTDATVHVENLVTAAFQVPGSTGMPLLVDSLLSAAGRLDVPVIAARGAIKAFPHTLAGEWLRKHAPQAISDSINRALMKHMTDLASIAQINASRVPHSGSVLGIKALGRGVLKADQVTRMVLNDSYANLVKQGLVKGTETNRREFINQAGNYNLRSQGPWMRLLRQTWTAPFATAGRNFATLGIRALTLNPGVEASSIKAAAALRASMAAKWVGSAVFVASMNYLITGKMMGRPGTKFGSIDTGKDDKQGNPRSFDVLAFTGQSRALRTVGARSAIDAARLGLGKSDIASGAMRDVANTALGAVAGPGPRFAVEALSGYPPAVSVGRSSPVVPPGENQFVQNVKSAAMQANPLLASIHEATKPGGSIGQGIARQLPRFTLATGKQQDFVDKYPEIVQKAQANAFIEDVIHQARKLPIDERRKFTDEQIGRLPEDLRYHAHSEVKRRAVFKYGSSSNKNTAASNVPSWYETSP